MVARRPPNYFANYKVTDTGRYNVPRTECVKVHFPRTQLTDRTFGIMDPDIHNDIAYNISAHWQEIVDALLPRESQVISYSFPVPLDAKHPGRTGSLRSGRNIYEFLGMIEDGITAVAYRYNYIVKTDIRNFYPSIYTHSIAWALHKKELVRQAQNIHNFSLLGNRLDKLFQNANDGCTNGIPIGSVVSDIIAEIVAAGVDVCLSRSIRAKNIDCEVIRFKDDYRILVKSEADGRAVIKHLQSAVKEYNLELGDDKTTILALPDGLFREWVSLYHAVHPKKRRHYSWKQFRELYLATLRIDKACPGTGVIDRFLADLVSRRYSLKVGVKPKNLQKVISMLLMMARLRPKAFPKVIAIIEAILRTPFGVAHKSDIVEHLGDYLNNLAEDEERNRYLITWISYFLVSNDLKKYLKSRPILRDPIACTVFNGRSTIFTDKKGYKLFVGCRSAGKRVTLLRHLDIFKPPEQI
jgi:hypothetical protein